MCMKYGSKCGRYNYEGYKSAGFQLIGNIGGYECVDKLLGHHSFGASDQMIWVDIDIPSKRLHTWK